MLGLLYKDIVNLKAQFKVMALLVILYSFFAFASGNSAMLGAIITILGAMMPITALAYDEKAHWDKYALTMPVSRNQIVMSKYLLGSGFVMIAFVINLIFNVITGMMPADMYLPVTFALTAAGFLFMTLLFPVMIKFGVEKGRIMMFLLILLPTIFAMIGSKLNLPIPSEELLLMLPYIGFVESILLCGISLLISMKIYQNKEF